MSEVWVPPPPTITQVDSRFFIVRDDLVEGGSKARFLPFLIEGAQEVVYGAPFCGGAPVALAAVGKHMGIKATIFYAQRKNPHRRQLQVIRLGAKVHWVPMGFMSHVQAKAKEYAQQRGALFLPLGFDTPKAEAPFIEQMRKVRRRIVPDEVWCATSSGMLARCLSKAFPEAAIKAVTVGLKSRWEKQPFTGNVELIDCPYRFEQEAKVIVPFPACGNYEAKAWEACMQRSKAKHVLFWNVIGR